MAMIHFWKSNDCSIYWRAGTVPVFLQLFLDQIAHLHQLKLCFYRLCTYIFNHIVVWIFFRFIVSCGKRFLRVKLIT